jgi:hypothetical protein
MEGEGGEFRCLCLRDGWLNIEVYEYYSYSDVAFLELIQASLSKIKQSVRGHRKEVANKLTPVKKRSKRTD